MYVKTINGRQVFSDCRTIQTNEGFWISNPTVEQILDAGWEEYIAPPVPYIARTEPAMTEILDAVKKMLASSVENLSDEDALNIAALYPTWSSKIGESVSIGERVWYDEKLYKVIQTHTIQSDWTPDTAVSLYTEVSIEEWPEFVQPTGAHDAYKIGDKITFEGQHYTSLIDNNIWSPSNYPAGWQLN